MARGNWHGMCGGAAGKCAVEFFRTGQERLVGGAAFAWPTFNALRTAPPPSSTLRQPSSALPAENGAFSDWAMTMRATVGLHDCPRSRSTAGGARGHRLGKKSDRGRMCGQFAIAYVFFLRRPDISVYFLYISVHFGTWELFFPALAGHFCTSVVHFYPF